MVQQPKRFANLAPVMKTILAAIDFSPVSRAVIAQAAEMARMFRGRLVLLNVVAPPSIVTDLAPLVGEVLQFTAEMERGARRHLVRLQKSLAERDIAADVICQQGYPVPLIIAHARKLGAQFIVIGSHGHTAFHDLVAGSTAHGVLKRSTCPVVVIPAAPGKRKRRKARRK